jgi:hypothetical protein
MLALELRHGTHEKGNIVKKFFITAGALVALAIPSVAMATQPEHPGGFGTERAYNIHTYFDGAVGTNWGTAPDGASARAGNNGALNNEWKAAHGFLPPESSHMAP